MLFNTPIFFDEDETSGGGGEPAAETAASAPPPETPAAGPWAADLVEYFGEDADGLAAADRYMREKVQPRITELEQNPGRELWKDIEKNADQAIYDLVASAYGNDVAQAYAGLFQQAEEETPAEPAPPAEASTRSPEDEELLEWARSKRDAELRTTRQSAYEQAKADFQKEHKDDLAEAELKFFDPFVVSANGDFDAALAAYKEYGAQYAARNGEPVPTPTPEPPAVLGSEGAAAAVPPVKPTYSKWNDLDGALDKFLSDSAATPTQTPPPIVS